MEAQSHAHQTIQSLTKTAGAQQAPWNSVRWRSAWKMCECCGKVFRPWFKQLPNGRLRVQKEKLWLKQRFCSISCSKIHSNCMQSAEVRRKVSAALKARNHKPYVRGGNGQLTKPQKMLLERLGRGWVAEYVVAVPGYKSKHLPKNLKIDIAHPQRMIAIELDGSSHRTPERRMQDSRKTLFLAENGWYVLRITNKRALELCSTCTSPATLLTLLTTPLCITATSFP